MDVEDENEEEDFDEKETKEEVDIKMDGSDEEDTWVLSINFLSLRLRFRLVTSLPTVVRAFQGSDRTHDNYVN